jgi:hypothetical protein
MKLRSPSVSIASIGRVLNRKTLPTNTDRYWSIKINQKVNIYTGERLPKNEKETEQTDEQWHEHLVDRIIDTSNDIHRQGLRGPADFMALPKKGPLLNVIKNANGRTLFVKFEEEMSQTNRKFVDAKCIGMFNNRFLVFETDKLPNNQILMGRFGDGLFFKQQPSTIQGTGMSAVVIPNFQVLIAQPDTGKNYMKNEVAYWGFIKVLDITDNEQPGE